MKTGIVMELRQDTAVLLQPDGTFVERKKQAGWVLGAVVVIHARSVVIPFKQLLAAAACLVLLLGAGFGGHTWYTEVTSIISIDINPSLELELNRTGRVVALVAYNQDGTMLLDSLALEGKPYSQAIPFLLQSEAMRPYLEQNEFLEVSVYSEKNSDVLVRYMEGVLASVSAGHPHMQTSCTGVEQALVEEAHRYGITPGRMCALLELQAVDPTVDLEDYSGRDIGAIRSRIRACHQKSGSGHQGRGHGAQSGENQP